MDTCRNCGTDTEIIEDGIRVSRGSKQFCSDTCRYIHNNNIRKAKSRITAINKAMRELKALSGQYPNDKSFDFIRDYLSVEAE